MAKKKSASKRTATGVPLLQYLVVINQAMDDVPIFTTDNPFEARRAARRVPDDGRVSREIVDALDVEETTPVCVSIVTFQDGIPVNREIVREY